MLRKSAVFLLILGGVLFSFKDYKNWKNEETKNFGHGPGEKYTPAKELEGRYQNTALGIRVRYPKDWEVSESLEIKEKLAGLKTDKRIDTKQILKNGDELIVLTGESPDSELKFQLEMGRTNKNLTDEVTLEVEKLAKLKRELLNDREYLNGDVLNWAIISWEEGEFVKKMGTAIKNGEVIKMKFEISKNGYDTFLKTVEEIIKNVRLT